MGSNLSNTDVFIHSGVISKLGDSSLTVSLDENVHCESCHAKGTCGISDLTSKEVEIPISENSYTLNEPVNVVLKKGLGLKAVFWAYVFPFVLMLSTLLIATSFLKEWVAGLLSLLVLVPYYLLLYVVRDTFKKTFTISILKI